MIDTRRLFLVTLPRWCLGGFVLLMAIAMWAYPGGTYRDDATEGYIFSQNFLSDLGRWSAWNGDQNFYAAFLFNFSFVVIGIVFTLFFKMLPSLFSAEVRLRKLTAIGSGAGILGGLCLIGIGFTPADVALTPHIFFADWFIRFFLVPAFCYSLVFFRSAAVDARYVVGYGLFALFIAAYIGVLEFGPDIQHSLSALKIQVVSQKLICLTFLGAVALHTYGNQEILDALEE